MRFSKVGGTFTNVVPTRWLGVIRLAAPVALTVFGEFPDN